MSPATAVDPAMGLAFLAAAELRAERAQLAAGARPGGGLGLGPIRESAGDVPALIVLARAGLRAQVLID